MKTLLAIAAVVCLTACPPLPPTPVPDAGPTGGSQGTGGSASVGGASGTGGATPACTTTCCLTCEALEAHNCPEAHRTALGKTCVAVCENARDFGLPWPALYPSSTLAQVRSAPFLCKGGK